MEKRKIEIIQLLIFRHVKFQLFYELNSFHITQFFLFVRLWRLYPFTNKRRYLRKRKGGFYNLSKLPGPNWCGQNL